MIYFRETIRHDKNLKFLARHFFSLARAEYSQQLICPRWFPIITSPEQSNRRISWLIQIQGNKPVEGKTANFSNTNNKRNYKVKKRQKVVGLDRSLWSVSVLSFRALSVLDWVRKITKSKWFQQPVSERENITSQWKFKLKACKRGKKQATKSPLVLVFHD